MADEKPLGMPEPNLLQKFLTALDWANNVGRTATYAAMDEKSNVWDDVKRAASGELETPAWLIRDKLDSMGLPGMKDIGVNDGKFQWGDIADVGRDVLVDVATDPLTYLTLGLGTAANAAGKGLLAAIGVASSANAAKTAAAIGKASEILNAANKAGVAAPAIAGGLIGAGSIDHGDSTLDGLTKVLGGATAGGVAKYGGSRIFDSLANSAALTKTLGASAPVLQAVSKASEVAAPAAVGGLLGAGTINPEDSLGEGLLKTALGAGAGMGLKYGKPVVEDKLSTFAKDLTNKIGQSKLHNLTNPDEGIRLGAQVMQRKEEIRNWIADGNLQALEGLDSTQQTLVSDLLTEFKNKINDKRIELFQNRVAGIPKSNLSDDLMIQINNEATRDATILIQPEIDNRLNQFVAQGQKDVVDSINTFVDFGSEYRKRINTEARKIANYVDPLSTGVGDPLPKDAFVGFKYYWPNIQPKDTMLDDIDEINFNFQQYQNQKQNAVLDPQKAWDIYAIKNSKMLLTPPEQQIYEDYVKYKGNSSVLADITRRYDDLLNFTKKNLLFASMTWHASNFADNMMKSYLELGFDNILKGNTLKNLLNGNAKDFFNLARGKNIVTKNSDLIEAAELGLIDSNMFKFFDDKSSKSFMEGKPIDPRMGKTTVDPATGTITQNTAGLSSSVVKDRLTDEDITKFITGPERPDFVSQAASGMKDAASQAIGPGASKTIKSAVDMATPVLERGSKIYDEILNISQGFGSAIENTGKLSFYVRARQKLMDSPTFKQLAASQSEDAAKEWAKKSAADWTKKTFFDYTEKPYVDIVASRAIPFFRFYRKNLSYWLDAFTDPAKVSRLAAVDSIRSNIGSPLEPSDEFTASQRILDNAPRSLGQDENGTRRYLISPKLSYVDALNALDFGGGESGSRTAPLIRGLMDLAQGFDSFSKKPLYPSDYPGGIKDMYGRGLQYTLFPGFTTDREGNPVASSDLGVALDKIRQSTMPTPVFDQLSSLVNKLATGRMGPAEATANLFVPLQQVDVTPLQASRTARRNASGVRSNARQRLRIEEQDN